MNRGYFTWRVALLVVAIVLFVIAGLIAFGKTDGNADALAFLGLACLGASQLP